jgi:hypothetical protein
MKKSILTLVVFFTSMILVTVSEFSGTKTWQEVGPDKHIGTAPGKDERAGETTFESANHFSGLVGTMAPDQQIAPPATGESPQVSESDLKHLMLPEAVVRQFTGQWRLIPINTLLPGVIKDDAAGVDIDKADADEVSDSSDVIEDDYPDFVDRKLKSGIKRDGGET